MSALYWRKVVPRTVENTKKGKVHGPWDHWEHFILSSDTCGSQLYIVHVCMLVFFRDDDLFLRNDQRTRRIAI